MPTSSTLQLDVPSSSNSQPEPSHEIQKGEAPAKSYNSEQDAGHLPKRGGTTPQLKILATFPSGLVARKPLNLDQEV